MQSKKDKSQITTCHKRLEKGNALFLILIAVALFAALSYAVTQSGRSGGGVDKEQAIISASNLVQQMNYIRTEIQRLYVLNEVDQIKFDNSAYSASNTYYPPDGTDATGRTVGLFNAVDGSMPFLKVDPNVLFTPGFNVAWFYNYNSQIKEAGVDIGSSAGDESLVTYIESQTICEQINKGLHGTVSIETYTKPGATSSNGTFLKNDGTVFIHPNAVEAIWDITKVPSCYGGPPYEVLFVMKEN